MSTEWHIDVPRKDVVQFLKHEYATSSGIPVHLFSVVNATFASYNKMIGITDGKGTLFFESSTLLKSYGANNPTGLIRALTSCGINFS